MTRAAAANGTGLAAACACAAAHTLRLGEARVCGHAANLECAPQAKAGWLQRHRMGDGGGGGGEARQFVDCLFFLSCLLLVVEAVDGDGARIAVTTTSTTTTISVSPIHPSIGDRWAAPSIVALTTAASLGSGIVEEDLMS